MNESMIVRGQGTAPRRLAAKHVLLYVYAAASGCATACGACPELPCSLWTGLAATRQVRSGQARGCSSARLSIGVACISADALPCTWVCLLPSLSTCVASSPRPTTMRRWQGEDRSTGGGQREWGRPSIPPRRGRRKGVTSLTQKWGKSTSFVWTGLVCFSPQL
jgi:hypothetical protein